MCVIEVRYFSDVLCILAYASQAHIDAVRNTFGDTVRIKHQFCSVFGDTARKVTSTWNGKGGYYAFNAICDKSDPKAGVRCSNFCFQPQTEIRLRNTSNSLVNHKTGTVSFKPGSWYS